MWKIWACVILKWLVIVVERRFWEIFVDKWVKGFCGSLKLEKLTYYFVNQHNVWYFTCCFCEYTLIWLLWKIMWTCFSQLLFMCACYLLMPFYRNLENRHQNKDLRIEIFNSILLIEKKKKLKRNRIFTNQYINGVRMQMPRWCPFPLKNDLRKCSHVEWTRLNTKYYTA